MQSDRNPNAFTFNKHPTENYAQYGNTQEFQADKSIYKLSAHNPNREMDQKKHNGIDDNRDPLSVFAYCDIQQPAPKNHFFSDSDK